MKSRCRLTMQGTPIEDSFQRFANAVQKATSSSALSKYQSTLEENLHHYLNENASRASIPINVEDLFSLKVTDNVITIQNSNSYLTDKYEYGYDEGDKIITPGYYMRPAFDKISDDLINLIDEEISNQYNSESSTTVNKSWDY